MSQINGRSCHRFKLSLSQSKFLSLSHLPDRQHGQPLCCRFVSIETLHTLMPGWTSEKHSLSVLVCVFVSWVCCRCCAVWFLGPHCFFVALDLFLSACTVVMFALLLRLMLLILNWSLTLIDLWQYFVILHFWCCIVGMNNPIFYLNSNDLKIIHDWRMCSMRTKSFTLCNTWVKNN